MTTAATMLGTHPGRVSEIDQDVLARCVDACYECAQACTACADACLAEDGVTELRNCIRLNLDCADVCDTTGRVLSRQTGFSADLARAVLQACAAACTVCGDECDRHAGMHEHCRVCAEACRRCERACNEVIGALG